MDRTRTRAGRNGSGIGRRHAVALPALICLLALPSTASAQQVHHKRADAGESRGDVLSYWTKARMRSAARRELVAIRGPGGRGITVRARRGEPRTVAAERAEPLRWPAAFGYRVDDPETPPQSAHGKLLGEMPREGRFSCSATVVSSPNRSTLFTAAHCVKVPWGPWARKLMFVPALDSGRHPYGRWIWREAIAPTAFARWGNLNFDFAAIVLARSGGSLIEDVVGSREIAFGRPARQRYEAFGYPMNRGQGRVPWACGSRFARSDPGYLGPGPRPIGIRCRLGVGASGGGWVINDRALVSLTSFGYGDRRNEVYGPRLGRRARSVWRSAGRG